MRLTMDSSNQAIAPWIADADSFDGVHDVSIKGSEVLGALDGAAIYSIANSNLVNVLSAKGVDTRYMNGGAWVYASPCHLLINVHSYFQLVGKLIYLTITHSYIINTMELIN